MADGTGIEWTDATWNPLRGCTKVDLDCRNCYAEAIATRFGGEGQPYHGTVDERGRWTGTIRLVPEHLSYPLRWQKPRRIFVNSMSDMFHENVPNEYIAAVFGVMAASPRHTFQVLTKRPERAAAWFKWIIGFAEEQRGIASAPCEHETVMRAAYSAMEPVLGELGVKQLLTAPWDVMKRVQSGYNYRSLWPLPNVWIGTSVGHAAAVHRIEQLRGIPASVRFLSCEPLHGPLGSIDLTGIGWVIVGGESGQDARPMHPEWARSLRDQCVAAGVPFFFKQWGEWAPPLAQPLIGGGCGTAAHYGGYRSYRVHEFHDGAYAEKRGKHNTGRILDGRTWDEYPTEAER